MFRRICKTVSLKGEEPALLRPEDGIGTGLPSVCWLSFVLWKPPRDRDSPSVLSDRGSARGTLAMSAGNIVTYLVRTSTRYECQP